jgi:putative ABC transport system ATP-binding protein
MLLKLNRSEGTTLVIVTHDPALSSLTDRIVHLRDGQIIDEQKQRNNHENKPE